MLVHSILINVEQSSIFMADILIRVISLIWKCGVALSV
uniref:Uncharacterized protein n=1 Tax=Rhizophora mucronata TaxID=61149 RepID=A0A2P2PHJ8_RHIMU